MKKIIVVLFLVVACIAHARDVQKATMLEYGIYAQAEQERIPDPNAPDGYILRGFTDKLLSSTNVIPARVGIKFGFRYSLAPEADAKQARLKIVYLCPKMTNPKTGKSFTRLGGNAVYTFGAPETYVLYNLEQEWEALPGAWTLQIWEGDKLLLEKKFLLIMDAKAQPPPSN